MIKLSDRLQLIANEINKGETMADIGTDHGFLPLSLWEQGKSPYVVMCDISKPSLQKAIDAAAELDGGDAFAFRAGDGLDVLEYGEVDAVVIAGMGGVLISEILESNICKTLSFKKFIMQPRNHSGALRFWLTMHGFDIVSNKLVREGKFICEIITAISPEEPVKADPVCGDYCACWDMPEELVSQPLFEDFAKTKIDIEKKILRGMQQGSGVDENAMTIVADRIQYMEKLLAEKQEA